MLRLCLIGCGRIGNMHLDLILNYFPEVCVQAIIDDNLAKLEQHRQIRCYPNSSIDTLLSIDAIDTVLIATPSSTHCDLIKKSLAYDKAVFCEKPISFDLDALDEIINSSSNRKLQVGLNRRWDPDFLLLKDKLRANALGKLHIIKITNRDPRRPDIRFVQRSGGLFLDFNIHDFDMAAFLCDDTVESIYADGTVLIQEELRDAGDIDTAIITLKMKKGTLVVIDSSRETGHGYDQRIEVLGEKGSLYVDNIPEHHNHYLMGSDVISAPPKNTFVERYQEAYINQLRAFFDYVKQTAGAASPVAVGEIKQALRVALAAQQSLHGKRIVHLSELAL